MESSLRPITWQTDPTGLLRGVSVHDGHLTGLLYSPRRLRVAVLNIAGETIQFELSGVQELTIGELWNGAIVGSIYAWKASDVPDTSWGTPDSGWGALFRNRVAAVDAGLMVRRIRGRAPEPWLVQLECSYGGFIAALCEALQVFQVQRGA
jgi:hypothetical protein